MMSNLEGSGENADAKVEVGSTYGESGSLCGKRWCYRFESDHSLPPLSILIVRAAHRVLDIVSLATCEVGRGVAATKPKPMLEMRLSAIGRYTYIVPSEDKVDFGTLLGALRCEILTEV